MGHDDGFDVYDADDWSKPNLETRGGHSTNSQFDFRGTTAAVASYDRERSRAYRRETLGAGLLHFGRLPGLSL